jgi:hypothetical protein
VERHVRGKGRASNWRNHTLQPAVSALHFSSIFLTACI